MIKSHQGSEAAYLLQNVTLRGEVPPNIAHELVIQGQVDAVAEWIEQFSSGISEQVTPALIAIGRKGVSAYLYHKNLFEKFSQAVFDALLKESTTLLRVIADNLAHFYGLNQTSASQLKEAGFEEQVKDHPECFQ